MANITETENNCSARLDSDLLRATKMEAGNSPLSASTLSGTGISACELKEHDQPIIRKLLEKEKQIVALEENIAKLRKSLNEMRSLAKLGEMSAAVAHEIRNPLAGISATAEVLKIKLGNDERAEFADVIIEEIGRLEKIVRDLLNYARIRKPYLAPTNIATELDRAFSATDKLLKTQNITLVRDYSTDVRIPIDAEQMHQVFLNIILNAAEAMSTGGVLNVSIRIPQAVEQRHDSHRDQNKCVEIEFADSGNGILEEDIENIFNPFFSTKTTGTGLGLAVCKKILKQHGASITARNRQEGGAAFTISLPITNNWQSQQQSDEPCNAVQ